MVEQPVQQPRVLMDVIQCASGVEMVDLLLQLNNPGSQ